MKTAATAIDIRPNQTKSSWQNAACPAAVQTCRARRIARNAQFSSAPESSAEIIEGDSLCASGNRCEAARVPFLCRNRLGETKTPLSVAGRGSEERFEPIHRA